jgi:hypothetical protein
MVQMTFIGPNNLLNCGNLARHTVTFLNIIADFSIPADDPVHLAENLPEPSREHA